jgi:hypothetical protein
VEALKRELQELRSISQASQVIASCFALQCVASRRIALLCCAVGVLHLGRFLSHIQCVSSQVKSEMDRALIEEEVLNDLADHPTVEYIRRLEDERT